MLQDMIEQLAGLYDQMIQHGFPEKAAKIHRASLDAMLAEGFTRDEAIQIISRQGTGIASK